VSRLLALAGLSARTLAESARDGGFRPIALDLFGDADTRRAAVGWWQVGHPERLVLDPERLLATLAQLRDAGALGWIAGSGFDGEPSLLAEGARRLPLIGNPAEAVAAVRDPVVFFGRLAALGIPYPDTRLDPPPDPSGWLRKDAASCGGRGVRPAGDGPCEPEGQGAYYQRHAPGRAMSALFLADGRRARLLGVNRQIVRRSGGLPFVFRGCIGPLPVAPMLRERLQVLCDTLAAAFGLRGANGVDFLLHGERIAVLEVNPRPPASMALYRGVLPGGLIRAHLLASAAGHLPREGRRAPPPVPVRGFEVVFARARGRIGAVTADALAGLDWCHDLPLAGSPVLPGAPVCTVSAEGGSAAGVRALLARRRRQIPSLLELQDDSSGDVSAGGRARAGRTAECQ